MSSSNNQTDTASFVFYRMPYEGNAYALYPDAIISVKDLTVWNFDKEGFLLAPFSSSKETPTLFFQGHPDAILPENLTRPFLPPPVMPDENRQEYTHLFHLFHNFIVRGEVSKIVLARSVSFPYPLLPVKFLFTTLAKAYPEAFVFTLRCPNGEIWFGATPELLLRGNKNTWHTAAVAGTMPYSEHGEDLSQWKTKDKEEHACVANFIERLLNTFHLRVERSPLQVRSAGCLHHLHTAFSMRGNLPVGNLLNMLHPTPAVCGFPTRKARNLILNHEHLNRKYYSGFLGPTSKKEKAFFVNIRSGCHSKDTVTLFAGGGLMKDSVEPQEWQETNWKFQTLIKFFQSP